MDTTRQTKQTQPHAARPVRRNNSGGARTLITAASLAAVLGGWGILADGNNTAQTATLVEVAAVAATADTAPAQQAMPTVVTLVAADTQTTASTSTATSKTQSQPTLRGVTAVTSAPRALATTRSSR